MDNIYSDWIFYGGLAGALGAGITIYYCAKKKGHQNLGWKQLSVIIVVFAFPTIMLPILLMPNVSFIEKIGVSLALILFGAVRYYATTKGQEAVSELRGCKKNQGKKRD